MSISLKPEMTIRPGLIMTPRLRRNITPDALKARTLLPQHKSKRHGVTASETRVKPASSDE